MDTGGEPTAITRALAGLGKFRGIYMPDGTPAEDVPAWLEAMEDAAVRRVGLTVCADRAEVSTVFIGIDLEAEDDGRDPRPYETAVAEGGHRERLRPVERYASRADAEAGHARHVRYHGGPEDA